MAWKQLQLLVLCNLVSCAFALPTIGQISRNQLETYEDLSDDFDLFQNLTFYFTCEDKPIGLYADIDYNCRVFHACDDSGKGFPVLCPNDTFFDQKQRVCTNEEDVDCEHAKEWFYLNELPYSTEDISEKHELQSIEDDIPSVVPLSVS